MYMLVGTEVLLKLFCMENYNQIQIIIRACILIKTLD